MFLPASLGIIRISVLIFIHEYLYSSFPGTMAYIGDTVWSIAKLEDKICTEINMTERGKIMQKGGAEKLQ